MESGAMVVHRFVGETLGICWMSAVNKKKMLALLSHALAHM